MVYVPPCNCPTTTAGTIHREGCFMLPVTPREEVPYPLDLIHNQREQIAALQRRAEEAEATLHAARVETVEACARLFNADTTDLSIRRWLSFKAMQVVRESIRSLLHAAEVATGSITDAALPADRVSTVQVCKHKWPIAYYCHQCADERVEASNATPTPASGGRSDAAKDLDRDIDKGPRACDPTEP